MERRSGPQWSTIARRQGGVITRAQARAAGLTDRQVTGRLATGEWRRMAQGVFVVGGASWTPEQPLWVAVLATGGVVSHRSAAGVWQLPVAPDRHVHVTVRDRRRICVPTGVRVHRVAWDRTGVTEVARLPVTTRTRTVLDCLGAMALGDARTLLDRCRQQQVIAVGDLERRLIGERGRWGNRQIGRLYREVTGAEAESERVLHKLLHAAGVHGWVANLRLTLPGIVVVIDVAFPSARLAIEVDGWAFHSDVARFRADRRKQNALTLAGWTVVRFTWADLVERPEYVVSTVMALLSATIGEIAT